MYYRPAYLTMWHEVDIFDWCWTKRLWGRSIVPKSSGESWCAIINHISYCGGRATPHVQRTIPHKTRNEVRDIRQDENLFFQIELSFAFQKSALFQIAETVPYFPFSSDMILLVSDFLIADCMSTSRYRSRWSGGVVHTGAIWILVNYHAPCLSWWFGSD